VTLTLGGFETVLPFTTLIEPAASNQFKRV